MQRHDVGCREQLLEVDDPGADAVDDTGVGFRATGEQHLHAEGGRPAGRREPDRAGPDDAERPAAQPGAEVPRHAPAPWLPRADPSLGGAEAAGGHEHERHREVGGRVGEHPGRVGHDDAALPASGDVDVVVADGDVRDDPQLRARGVEELGVDTVDEHRDEGVGARDRGEQLVPRHRRVDGAVGDVVPRRGEAGRGVAGDGGGDEDAGHGHISFRTRGSGRWRIALPSGTQGQAGTSALAFSFSIASTMARTPGSVSTMNGVFLTRSFISERM